MIISDSSKIPNIILTQPHIIKGHEIYCQEYFPKNFPFYFKNFHNGNFHNLNKKNDYHSRKIFIGGLPPETTKEDLINFFQKYGEIDYCIVNKDMITDKPRGI